MLPVAAAYGTARLAVMGFIDDVMDNAEADTESDGGTEPPPPLPPEPDPLRPPSEQPGLPTDPTNPATG